MAARNGGKSRCSNSSRVAATVGVLILAANTAFSGFPTLASRLARDAFLPRQLQARGDRFAFTNGILLLLLVAVVLTVAFGANVNSLIQLYIVGVFVSFTLTQAGMVRHWAHVRRMRPHPGVRRELFARRAVALVAFVLCAAVLVVVAAVAIHLSFYKILRIPLPWGVFERYAF